MDKEIKMILIIIAIIILASAILNPWQMMSYNMMTGFGLGGILMILALVVIILLIIWLAQQIQKSK
jgi:uncharacterized membrane protein